MKMAGIFKPKTKTLLMVLLLALCVRPAMSADYLGCDPPIADLAPRGHVEAQINKLTPITIAPDLSSLPPNEQSVIHCLVEASRIIDRIFMDQVSANNIRLERALQKLAGTPDHVYLDYFRIMYGPWDRLDNNAPFINLAEARPAGANYYPPDLTQDEFEAWLDAHPEDEALFTSPMTLIRRHHGRQNLLRAVPYSHKYHYQLLQAALLLYKAAWLTDDDSLATYLRSRARAFLTNNYRQSDIDWIGLNGDIELVIGPYETYEDELFGFKAAFESFVCLVDHQESEKLQVIESFRKALIDNYPLPPGLEINPKGLASPIKVVNEVYSAGDARVGIPAIAFNLPNDEWVRANVGSKNVMLKNMLEAKYEGILVPIKERILSPSDKDKPRFEGFFNFVLMHEISHGLGPGIIVVNGQQTTVKERLKELYSTIEECQADTLSVYNTQYLIDAPNSPFTPELGDALYASYLAGMFRSIRFGTGSAHGGAITIELNWHLENGGFNIDSSGLFYLDVEKLKASVKSLATKLLVIELTGDYDGAKALIDTYRHVSPEIQAALDKITDVPTDVIKRYPFDK